MKKILFSIAIAFILNTNAQINSLLDFNGANGAYPSGSFISDGTFLYGMTAYGGTYNLGTIFKIKIDGTGYSKILDFEGTSNGSQPLGTLYSDGNFLYGITSTGGDNSYGVIFKIKNDGTGYTKMHDFIEYEGALNGKLISDGTFLYGIGYGGNGKIFKIKPDGTGYTVLFNFPQSNGFNPAVGASLFYDGIFLYGITEAGGTYNSGSIFKINPDGTGYEEIYSITGTYNAVLPQGSLISDGTFLYGMSIQGGSNSVGNIFKIKHDGTNYTNLHDFGGYEDYGGRPVADLLLNGEFLYGMTGGGANNKGLIFKIKTDGTGYTNLHDFNDTDGNDPRGSLIISSDCFYGMTSFGGANNNGVIFSFCSSLNEITQLKTNDTQIKIYPNPSSGHFFIEFNTTDKLNVEINDLNGRSKLSRVLSDKESINVTTLENGVYTLTIKTSNQLINKKIIILR